MAAGPRPSARGGGRRGRRGAGPTAPPPEMPHGTPLPPPSGGSAPSCGSPPAAAPQGSDGSVAGSLGRGDVAEVGNRSDGDAPLEGLGLVGVPRQPGPGGRPAPRTGPGAGMPVRVGIDVPIGRIRRDDLFARPRLRPEARRHAASGDAVGWRTRSTPMPLTIPCGGAWRGPPPRRRPGRRRPGPRPRAIGAADPAPCGMRPEPVGQLGPGPGGATASGRQGPGPERVHPPPPLGRPGRTTSEGEPTDRRLPRGRRGSNGRPRAGRTPPRAAAPSFRQSRQASKSLSRHARPCTRAASRRPAWHRSTGPIPRPPRPRARDGPPP